MNKRLYKLMNWPKIEEIVYSESDNPHEIMGAHVSLWMGIRVIRWRWLMKRDSLR